jgi:hypothetical protein
MANRTWINRVRHTADGEPVSAATDGRPTRDLEGNAAYLRARIDAAELGEGVVAYDETVEPGVLPGMAVYRNPATARYERALAAVELDPGSGTLVPAASSDVVGVVVFKASITGADILLAGRGRVDISAAVEGGGVVPGRYYLSASAPGKLTRQRPPVSVSVLVYTDDGVAIVQPIQRDFLEDHVHYKVPLHARPAGLNVLAGGRHVVGSPDPTLPGWLPADHDSFHDQAPPGAAFGYNLAAHPELARIFPPIPPSSAQIIVDRARDHLGGTLAAMGPGGLCHVDSTGIWWMSDCQGDTPWPEDWAAEVLPMTGNDPEGPECPREEDFQVILAFVAMVFTTEKTVVTSLQAAEHSPLRITNCDGKPARTGDLTADVELEFLVGPDPVDGSLAFKELTGSTLSRGRVVEGLRAGPGCTLISNYPKPDPDTDEVTHQGIVVVSLDANPVERELPADLIRLAQTQERYHLDIPYIGMDAGRATSLRMRFYVPTAGLPPAPTVAIRLQLLGRATGTLPALTLTYRILPRPTEAVDLPGPANETTLAIATAVPVAADQYVEVQSDPVSVAAGDTILIAISRASTDGYAGEVGIMRPVGILTGTPPPP